MAASMISSIPSSTTIMNTWMSLSGSLMWSKVVVNSTLEVLPNQVKEYFIDLYHRFWLPRAVDPNTSVVVVKREDRMRENELFAAVETYLYSVRRPEIRCLKVSRVAKDPGLIIRYGDFDKIEDSYQGIHLEWRFTSKQKKDKKDEDQSKTKHFELSFDSEFRDTVLDSYLPWVVKRAEEIKADSKKVVRLHSGPHETINLEHPSTFETLAMDPEMKKMIVDDLDRFLRRKDFYKRVGKAWKRGYLLYGPPGTGKSSLIAAMANYLKF